MPRGSWFVTMTRLPGLRMVRVNVRSSKFPFESVTRTTNVEGPVPVGVPWIDPDAAMNERPAGREPLVKDQDSGARPPTPLRRIVKGVFWRPLGRAAGDTIAGGDQTVSVSSCVSLWTGALESDTETMIWKMPDSVGVPEMMPVVALSVSPAGSVPAARPQL